MDSQSQGVVGTAEFHGANRLLGPSAGSGTGTVSRSRLPLTPVALDPLLSAHHAPKDTLWIPYAGFPINWGSARIIRKFVEAYHREETEDVADRLRALGEVAADHAEAQRLRTLQRELSAFSSKIFNAFFPTLNSGAKEFDAPPVAVKEKILEFLQDLRVSGIPSSKERRYHHLRLPLVINQWLAIAAIHGVHRP